MAVPVMPQQERTTRAASRRPSRRLGEATEARREDARSETKHGKVAHRVTLRTGGSRSVQIRRGRPPSALAVTLAVSPS